MKKITLLTLCMAVTSLSFGQASLSGFAANATIERLNVDPCTQDYTGGPQELAIGITGGLSCK